MEPLVSFEKIDIIPLLDLVVGRIYFETSTNTIKVATSTTTVDKFCGGVKSASLDPDTKILKIVNENGEEISLDLSDLASASSITAELSKKLNIGALDDASTAQSYYGLKKYTDEVKSSAVEFANQYTDEAIQKIPPQVIYKGDESTIIQSGTDEVIFEVGTIPQNKVTNLTSDLSNKATVSALNAVKATAEAAAPQATTYTKTEVDNKVASAVGSVYKMKGSVDNVAALTALTEVAIGDVYNVVATGTLNGETFEAGSNFVAIKAGAGSQIGMWDKLGGTVDLSDYAKSVNIANTYATKTSVTSEINTKLETLDKADTAVAGQVVSAVSETNGIISVSRRALVAGDIPTLATSKISGLDTALNGKVPTTRTINSKPLSANVVLSGEDITVGGNGTYKTSNIQSAIEAIDNRIIVAASSGVQSFGGQTGEITVDSVNNTNGRVKFSIVEKQLKGVVNGLGSAAYTNSTEYDKIGAADTALQEAKNYVNEKAATELPKQNGTAATGTSSKYAKEDHVHPTDTTRVPTSRNINAGTGLSGGGNLTADRTLSVKYGNTAGTAAQGNDARLSDRRDPNAKSLEGINIDTLKTVDHVGFYFKEGQVEPVGTYPSFINASHGVSLNIYRSGGGSTVHILRQSSDKTWIRYYAGRWHPWRFIPSSSSFPLGNSTTPIYIDSNGHLTTCSPYPSSISGNAGTATKLQTARTIGLSGDVAGSGSFDGSANLNIVTTVGNDSHTHSNSTITSIDASKITSGTIDVARLPKGALERLVIVANQTARFALTTNDVQEGDTVKQTDTGVMYFVTDSTKLNSEAGYSIYTAGAATSVPWSGVSGKPSTFTPSSHTHSNITINTGTGLIGGGNLGNNLTLSVNLTEAINALPLGTPGANIHETDYFVSQYVGGNELTPVNATYYRRSMYDLYNYIKRKLTWNTLQNKPNLLQLGETAETAYAGNKGLFTRNVINSLHNFVMGRNETSVGQENDGVVLATNKVNLTFSYYHREDTDSIYDTGSFSMPIPAATTSLAGVMSSTDKDRLDKIWNGNRCLPLTGGTVTGNIYLIGASKLVLGNQGGYISHSGTSGANLVYYQNGQAVFGSDDSGTTKGLVLRSPSDPILRISGTEYTIYSSHNLKNISQLTNDANYVTTSTLNNYLPLTGGSMTGVLSVYSSGGSFFNGIAKTALKFNNLTAQTNGDMFESFWGMRNYQTDVLLFGAHNKHVGFWGFNGERTEAGYDHFFVVDTNTWTWKIDNNPIITTKDTASSTKLGIVKVGSGINVSNGTISVSLSSVGAAASTHTHTVSQISGAAKVLHTSTLLDPIVQAGFIYNNTTITSITELWEFTEALPDAVIVSTKKISFNITDTDTASGYMLMADIDSLSGTYYIYCFSYMPNGKVAINGAAYN